MAAGWGQAIRGGWTRFGELDEAADRQEWGYADLVRDERFWMDHIYSKLDPDFCINVPDPNEDLTIRYDKLLEVGTNLSFCGRVTCRDKGHNLLGRGLLADSLINVFKETPRYRDLLRRSSPRHNETPKDSSLRSRVITYSAKIIAVRRR
ncbi:hypothetical protein HBI68_098270 [Parastagonospora nodorum]|nr:hypothetical protein HBI68_098270 [Parastagonospora nodorum]